MCFFVSKRFPEKEFFKPHCKFKSHFKVIDCLDKFMRKYLYTEQPGVMSTKYLATVLASYVSRTPVS